MNKTIQMVAAVLAGVLLLTSCEKTQSLGDDAELQSLAQSYLEERIYDYESAGDPALPTELQELTLATNQQDIQTERELVWHLWQEAMQEEVARLGMDSIPSDSTDVIWDIPEEQRMKVRFLTKGERPAAGYPLFINLHGGGMDSSVMGPWGSLVNESEWAAALTLGGMYEDAPSLYIVPRMADDRIGRWYLYPQREAYSRAIRAALASELVDPERLYLIGISEGGYGAHRLSLFEPDKFTAFGPMAAAEPMGDYAMNLRNTNLRLEMGEHDTAYSRNTNAIAWQAALDSLQQANPGDFQGMINIQEGRGHSIDYFQVAPWAAEQTERCTYPELITYQFHDLSGFPATLYYLDFSGLTFPSKEARPVLEVLREGNSFDLQLSGEGQPTGTLRLYLHEDEVDLKKSVTITLNGVETYKGKAKPSIAALLESMATFGDPLRIFPAYIELTL